MSELRVTIDGKDALEIVVDHVQLETQEEKQRTEKLEQKLKEVFTKIPDSVHVVVSSVEEHIQIIT
jgi:hypothetical protein